MLPTIRGVIDRRILLNFGADPNEVVQLIPDGMNVREVGGRSLVGVCLIRFRNLRPVGIPALLGVGSENAAFRISVEWDGAKGIETGVYVLQRVTNSRFITLCGGRVFPGVHQLANFTCRESRDSVDIKVEIPDQPDVRIVGAAGSEWNSEIFADHGEASEFFHRDRIGYSPDRKRCSCEGLELECLEWSTKPLLTTVNSAPFFSQLLPSARFDHALIMHDIEHKWHEVLKYDGKLNSAGR